MGERRYRASASETRGRENADKNQVAKREGITGAFPEVRGYPTVRRRTAANGVGVNPRNMHTPNRACGDEAREIRNCIRHARLRTLPADVLVSDSVEGFLGRAGQKARE